MASQKTKIAIAALFGGLFAASAQAHDPIFGIGPHVLYKGGIEISPELHIDKRGGQQATDLGLELTYGITGDWAAGVDLPYAFKSATAGRCVGIYQIPFLAPGHPGAAGIHGSAAESESTYRQHLHLTVTGFRRHRYHSGAGLWLRKPQVVPLGQSALPAEWP